MSRKEFYRVGNIKTEQGLWYDQNGNFTGLIHNDFNFCMNKDLPMPFDPDIVGWLSTTATLEDLFNWFSKEDIKKLEKHGWYISIYIATDYREKYNHYVINQETSKLLAIMIIGDSDKPINHNNCKTQNVLEQ